MKLQCGKYFSAFSPYGTILYLGIEQCQRESRFLYSWRLWSMGLMNIKILMRWFDEVIWDETWIIKKNISLRRKNNLYYDCNPELLISNLIAQSWVINYIYIPTSRGPWVSFSSHLLTLSPVTLFDFVKKVMRIGNEDSCYSNPQNDNSWERIMLAESL